MYNGFYELQESCAGNIRGFMDKLDAIEAELPDTVVSVASFFVGGFDGHLALRLADDYGLDVCTLHDKAGQLLHVFNTVQSPSGQTCYLDGRGVTDEPDRFLALYEADLTQLSAPRTRQEVEQLIVDDFGGFMEDKISDSMVDWVLSTFPENFAPVLQDKEKRKSLAEIIKEAEKRKTGPGGPGGPGGLGDGEMGKEPPKSKPSPCR